MLLNKSRIKEMVTKFQDQQREADKKLKKKNSLALKTAP